jgi:hypothetical protein
VAKAPAVTTLGCYTLVREADGTSRAEIDLVATWRMNLALARELGDARPVLLALRRHPVPDAVREELATYFETATAPPKPGRARFTPEQATLIRLRFEQLTGRLDDWRKPGDRKRRRKRLTATQAMKRIAAEIGCVSWQLVYDVIAGRGG